MVLPQLLWRSHGQLRLEMVVECPPNVSAKHLASSSLMGEQREVLALIISHWNESCACVREECCGSESELDLWPSRFSHSRDLSWTIGATVDITSINNRNTRKISKYCKRRSKCKIEH